MKKELNFGVLLRSWRVVAACMLMMWLAYGMRIGTISLLTGTMTADLGIPRGPFSFNTTFRYLVAFVLSLFFGRLVRRFGIRRVLAIGFVFTSAGELLFAVSRSLPMICFAGAVSGGGVGLASATATAVVVGDHFASGKGTVLGVTAAFSGVGAAVFNPIVGVVTGSFGWRTSFWMSAAVSAVAGVAAILFLNAHERRMGKAGVESASPASGEPEQKTGIPLAGAKKMPQFSVLLVTAVMIGFTTTSGYQNYPVHLGDVGFTLVFVASVASVILSVCNSVGKLIFGAVNDRVGIGKAALVPIFMSGAGMVFALFSSGQFAAGAILAGVGLGCGVSLNTLVPQLWTAGIFGKRDSAALMGYAGGMVMLGAALGMPVSNLMYDATGSYDLAYIVNTALTGAIALAAVLVLGRKKAIRYEA